MNKEIIEFNNLLNLLQSKENKLFNNKGTVELLFKYKTNFEINKKEIEFIGKVKVIISETLNKYEFQINLLPEIFKLFLQLNSKKDLQNKLLDLKLNSILNLKEIEDRESFSIYKLEVDFGTFRILYDDDSFLSITGQFSNKEEFETINSIYMQICSNIQCNE
jgi:hypothetical protein